MFEESDHTEPEVSDEPVCRMRVYPSGFHEGMMTPEFLPHAAHSIRNLLRDAAYYATGDLRDALKAAHDILAPHDPTH